MGAAGNVAAIRDALYEALARRGIVAASVDPWFFPTLADYRERLANAGFSIQRIETFDRPTTLPGSVESWLHTFAGAYLSALPASEHEAVIAEACAALRPRLCRDGVWVADYVRLRFAVTRPAS
jgi:hypothetical protein